MTEPKLYIEEKSLFVWPYSM